MDVVDWKKKVMAKTKHFVKKEPKMANFLCIFAGNLRCMAPPK